MTPSVARKPLVLCVDDQPLILKLLQSHLAGGPARVECAIGAEAALAAVAKERPDLVLLDVRMPNVDGYELCARLQREHANLAIIFMSAYGEEQDKARGFAAGAVDYLVKPITKAGLLASLERHLGTSRRWSRLLPAKPAASSPSRPVLDLAAFRRQIAELRKIADTDPALANISAMDLYSACPDLGMDTAQMAQHAAAFAKAPYLATVDASTLALGILPPRFCIANDIVPLRDAANRVGFVVSNPFDFELRETVRRAVGHLPRVHVTDPANIAALLGKVMVPPAPAPEEEKPETGLVVIETIGDAGDVELRDLTTIASRKPIIKLVNELIAAAVAARASDLHIEPRKDTLGVRFRVDGMLEERPGSPKRLCAAVVSRIKIIAGLDITQRRVPQDGRVRVQVHGREIDLRVSTLPSRHGEKVVIRILDHPASALTFEALGLSRASERLFRESIKKPHGLVLVTGPTGSGKTTTLYTALQALNDPHRNIVTVEDPIEIEIDRVNQVQVAPQTGLSFAEALRSILRQDPDVILVGEIRDAETLDIAMKASLTGHLVLSTLHTNDAASTVTRLLDMAPAYLVASTLEMVAAQRLVRKLCATCKRSAKSRDGQVVYGPVGCPSCRGSGFSGRTPVVEVMVIDEQLRALVRAGADADALRRDAVERCGMKTMRDVAQELVAAGITSLAEMTRAVG